MARSSSSDDDSFIKSGYWPSYRNDTLPPDSIDTIFFNHLYYAFIIPSSDTFELIVSNEDATLMSNFTNTLHNKNPSAKTLLSIGGGNIPDKSVFANLSSNESSRTGFINSAIEVSRSYGFDGMDLDWEYPTTDNEMNNFGLLLQEWRAAIIAEAEASSKTPLLLTGAVYYAATTYDRVTYPIDSVVNNMDWINLMTYDYHGPWETPTRTGVHTTLYDPNSNANTDYGLKSWIQSGVSKDKLVLGLAMYGRVWNLTNAGDNGIGAPATNGSPGELTFAEIVEFNETSISFLISKSQRLPPSLSFSSPSALLRPEKMEIEVDWDLHAVVRGCYTTTNNLKNQQQQPPHVEKIDQNHDKLFRHESMLNLDSFTTSTTTSVVTAPPSPPPPPPQHQPPELFDQLFRPFLISPLFTPTTESRNRHLEPSISSSNLIHPRNTTTASRSKRRKSQFKKVCEVPAAGLATDDKWSWRKYGQKPIKGSPYPRGYYRCSSSKGCPARKQVERSRTDPNKFIITYTSEHNHAAPTHRNSLAGISRHQNSNKLSVLQSSKPGTSSSSVPTSPSDDDDEMQQSVKTEVTQFELDEILCHEDDEEEAKDVLLDDDFFDGLDEMKLPLGHQIAPI